ncbi:large subunit of alpha-aminoadipate reductase, partial [Spiromyces aspiralis]
MPDIAPALDPVELESRIARWRDRLTSPTELQLPTDYPRPVPLKVVEGVEEFTLPESAGLAVLQLSLALQQQQQRGRQAPDDQTTASPFTVLLAAFAVLLHRYTAEEDIVVGSSSESSNPLVLRFNVKPSDTFLDVLRTVHNVEAVAARDEVPFDQLVTNLLGDAGDAVATSSSTSGYGESKTPSSLFRVRFFNQTDTNETTLRKTISAATDLTVIIRQKSTESLRKLHPLIQIQITYNQVLFSPARIRLIGAQLQRVLDAALTTSLVTQMGQVPGPDHHVGNIDIVSSLDRAVLPDPEADLNWSVFPGSITSTFVRNALAAPERPFVTETVLRSCDSGNNSNTGISAKIRKLIRTFNYGQILRAARIVSRYLRLGGIQREDVVVVYAYRGVDLVIAILGVLMAGATYSVIDPAYPPARQNIYLSVAKPRCLLIIEQAGELSDEVKAYVKDELEVVCTLPALAIQDDGQVRGGSLPGTNID